MIKRTSIGKARLLALSVLVTMALAAAGPAATASPPAHASRTITVTQTAQLRLVKRIGAVLYEQGRATGTFNGVVAAQLTVNAAKVGGEITFYPRGGGTITVKASGKPDTIGTTSRASGSMTIVKSTGRFSGARGRFRFNATLNRNNWALSVSASGRMTY